ncbi:LOW QUALITY PROTEIN: F-box protein At2g40925, partial [Arabidopsis lyrata subsp. lyrata]|uniref:LOW QUALITY PROTEIN: F-box protein At2g40925 n=1 Tax=Arabidopsis lyrata subsp. lyrata TaxID=81972 RepID=UPI000A29C411
CDRNSYEIASNLPHEVQVRLKAVVIPHLLSIILQPFIYYRHTHTTTQQQPRLYMCLVTKDNQGLLLSSTSPDNTSFVVVHQDLSIPGIGGYFLDAVPGLMCFQFRTKACIYNPSTKQILTLPSVKSDITAQQGQLKSTQYVIGRDPVNDQYKLFCTIEISSQWFANMRSEHWVFTLEARGSWKKVVPLGDYHPHAPATAGRSIHGVVHYLAWVDLYNCAVVSFDIMSEEVTTFLLPQKIRDVPVPALMMKADLIEYDGKLAIFNHSYLKDECSVDLWVLKDAGMKKWSNKRLVLQPCQRHLVHDIDLIVKGTTQDGKVMLAPLEMCSQFYILFHDVQSNDLRKVEIKGVPRLWFHKECYFDLKFVDESESFIYVEI